MILLTAVSLLLLTSWSFSAYGTTVSCQTQWPACAEIHCLPGIVDRLEVLILDHSQDSSSAIDTTAAATEQSYSYIMYSLQHTWDPSHYTTLSTQETTFPIVSLCQVLFELL